MLLPAFQLEEPNNVQQAQSLLINNENSKILAGGTDLLVKIKTKTYIPQLLVSINRITELDFLVSEASKLRIGAMTTIDNIEHSKLVKGSFAALAEACGKLGSFQIRNIATIGGNLCNAAPSAETAAPLLALEAKVRIIDAEGNKIIPLSELFKGPSETNLKKGEILAEIIVPKLPERSASKYLKFGLRSGMDIAIVGVAVVLTLDNELKRCTDVRVALGAVAPVPVRSASVEKSLIGEEISQKKIQQIAELVTRDITPISDVRATAEYRQKLAKVLTARALIAAWNDILQQS